MNGPQYAQGARCGQRALYPGIAERLREAVASEPFSTSAGDLLLTVSQGVATLEDGDEPQSLERRADQALYRAKRKGRNRVEISQSGRNH